MSWLVGGSGQAVGRKRGRRGRVRVSKQDSVSGAVEVRWAEGEEARRRSTYVCIVLGVRWVPWPPSLCLCLRPVLGLQQHTLRQCRQEESQGQDSSTVPIDKEAKELRAFL
jgi:hypothetical protein